MPRLAQEGAKMPKPLVKVCGETLIGRLIRIFMENDATEILVICNEASTLVSDYLSGLRNNRQGQSIPLRVIRKTTPSSMHSFYELSKYMSGNEPFVLTLKPSSSWLELKKQRPSPLANDAVPATLKELPRNSFTFPTYSPIALGDRKSVV